MANTISGDNILGGKIPAKEDSVIFLSRML